MDFDESLLPEDSWENDLATDEYEVEKILDVRSGRGSFMSECIDSIWCSGRYIAIRLGSTKRF